MVGERLGRLDGGIRHVAERQGEGRRAIKRKSAAHQAAEGNFFGIAGDGKTSGREIDLRKIERAEGCVGGDLSKRGKLGFSGDCDGKRAGDRGARGRDGKVTRVVLG